MDKNTIIYYTEDKEKMGRFKTVFEKLKTCGNLQSKYFSISSSKVIKEPMDLDEESFNQIQKNSFSNGYNKVIYSFGI
tara:strand:+ start:9662 stop:9895 length:234 start_codon:yes stop_codon:yes gene_type:complete